VIFTNVALTDDGDVWWEGMKDTGAGPHLIDWQGKDWTPAIAKETGAKAAHPNSRFTVAATNNPALDRLGRPGRRADRRLHLRWPPLHHRAAGDRGPQLDRRRLHGRHHGLGDHRRRLRRAGRGAPRPVRHAALLRLQHERLLPALAGPGRQARGQRRQLPKIFCVNWFRKNADGKFVWPGYGDNMRVLKWMIDRIEGKAQGQATMFGTAPRLRRDQLDRAGLQRRAVRAVTSIDKAPGPRNLPHGHQGWNSAARHTRAFREPVCWPTTCPWAQALVDTKRDTRVNPDVTQVYFCDELHSP
jgi:phosphoenolpyruvate carboxykinase (GTP)